MTLALIACLTCDAHAQRDRTTDTNQSQQQGADTTDVVTVPRNGQPMPGVVYIPIIVPEQKKAATDPYEPSCDSPKEREEADLCEQRRMAQAAEDAVFWARFQTGLGIISFIAVVASLFFAGWAANTASRQVELSRTALILTERAFLYCERIQSGWHAEKETDTIKAWAFTPIWRCAGTTPPKNTLGVINHWVGVGVPPLPDNFDFPDYGDARPTAIGPGAEMHGAQLIIPVDTLEKMRAGNAHAYIWGGASTTMFSRKPRGTAQNFVSGSRSAGIRSTKSVVLAIG